MTVKALHDYLQQEMLMVNHELLQDIPDDIDLLQSVFHHIFSAGGKRLRPLLTLAISKALSEKVTNASVCLAAAVELIHTATLLHDDVIDNASMRRNSRTANSIWNNKTSILVGDNMFSKAFQLIVKSNHSQAFKELADASAIISAAEVWQIQILNKINISIDEYLRLITDKTAVLFGAACAVGAITSSNDIKIINAARDFGIHFGICYQIYDDLIDYFENEESIGKNVFQDIREGKITLPLILLFRELEKYNILNEIAFVKECVGQQNIDTQKLLKLFFDMKIKDLVNDFIKKYSQKALENLHAMNCFCEITDLLKEFTISFWTT